MSPVSLPYTLLRPSINIKDCSITVWSHSDFAELRHIVIEGIVDLLNIKHSLCRNAVQEGSTVGCHCGGSEGRGGGVKGKGVRGEK